jgi:acetyltransferase
MIAAASKIDQPGVVLKSNTTAAGRKAAMSHTAALANNEDIIDAAFERSGIIRIHQFNDFISMAKVFELPPMRGKRMMVMSPAGGFPGLMADLCEASGSSCDPGADFYISKNSSSPASSFFLNPLDMGGYLRHERLSPNLFSVIIYENEDGAVLSRSGRNAGARMYL